VLRCRDWPANVQIEVPTRASLVMKPERNECPHSCTEASEATLAHCDPPLPQIL
jgi:hypothetical protein